jgi:serine/threonine protein kinase
MLKLSLSLSCVQVLYTIHSFSLGGTLFTLIEDLSKKGEVGVSEDTLLSIFSDLVNGVIHMHLQNPPITHRDIKVLSPISII